MIERLEGAFLAGDADTAFTTAKAICESLRDVVAEAASLRFHVNFGTPICDRCDGLRAGPGVVATCYQMRQCHYGNFKEGEASPRQRRALDVLNRLSDGSQGGVNRRS